MKRSLILITLLLICTMCLCFAEEKPSRVDLSPVNLDDTWQVYNLDYNTFAFCPITLPANGHLDLTIQTFFDDSHYSALIDRNNETINRIIMNGAGTADPQTEHYSYDLTAGQYWAVVESWNGCMGEFRIKAAFKPSTADDNRDDDSLTSATEISGDTVTGFLSSADYGGWMPEALPADSQDLQDYYVMAASNGPYQLHMTSPNPESTFDCYFYDARYEEINRTYGDVDFEIELPDRSVYICVKPCNSISGDYILTVNKEGEDGISALEQTAEEAGQTAEEAGQTAEETGQTAEETEQTAEEAEQTADGTDQGDETTLEETREFTDLANIRSAYAQLMALALGGDPVAKDYSDSQHLRIHATTGTEGAYTYSAAIRLTQTQDGWQSALTDNIAGMDLSSLDVGKDKWVVLTLKQDSMTVETSIEEDLLASEIDELVSLYEDLAPQERELLLQMARSLSGE